MRIHGIARLEQISRCFRKRFIPSALILVYHRVAEVLSDPQLLCVTPQHFAEHLEILRKYYRPIELQQLVKALGDGSFPRQSVVITFDDGYADNLYNAKPLLERHDISATVFMTTGYIEHEREFWSDEVERVLLQPGILPQSLCLNISGKTYEWELGEMADYSEDAYRRHRGWNVQSKDTPSLRHLLYRTLHQRLRPLPDEERQKVLKELLAWAKRKPMVRATHRLLSSDEVFRLAEGELVEVGAHTVTHPVLSALPLDAQSSEIYKSKACLEEILGRPVDGFAYPYGLRSDYTQESVAIVREAGFIYACSNFAGVVRRGTDHFQLPRILVRDGDGEELARWLRTMFETYT